jgi:hypothetical protein
VVEVAEFFSAQTWAAATAAIDVDAAALVTCRFWCAHSDPSPGAIHSQNLQKFGLRSGSPTRITTSDQERNEARGKPCRKYFRLKFHYIKRVKRGWG